MICPKCNHERTLVVNSRENKDKNIRRRRMCASCYYRFTTWEKAPVIKDEVIKLLIFGIEITLSRDGNGGSIISDLHIDPNDIAYESAIDGLESLILAHACSGINTKTSAYLEGIETAVEAIAHNA